MRIKTKPGSSCEANNMTAQDDSMRPRIWPTTMKLKRGLGQ